MYVIVNMRKSKREQQLNAQKPEVQNIKAVKAQDTETSRAEFKTLSVHCYMKWKHKAFMEHQFNA